MSVRVAHGKRENLSSAIEKGVVPKDSIIITRDADPELLFYNVDGELVNIHDKTRFETTTEAVAWVKKYGHSGQTVTIHNGADWALYIVQDDFSLSPLNSGAGEITNINRIDGGKPGGLI